MRFALCLLIAVAGVFLGACNQTDNEDESKTAKKLDYKPDFNKPATTTNPGNATPEAPK